MLRLCLLALTFVAMAAVPAAAEHPDDIYWHDFGVPPRTLLLEYTASVEFQNSILLVSTSSVCISGCDDPWSGTVELDFYIIHQWDGSNWTVFDSGWGHINVLTVYDGQLYAGGGHSYTYGIPQAGDPGPAPADFTSKYIARWDGSVFQPLGYGVNHEVLDMIVYNGDLIVAGAFTEADSMAVGRVARWDGLNWYPMGEGMNGTVYDLAIFQDTLVAGGGFSQADGDTVHSVVSWNGTGWQAVGSWETPIGEVTGATRAMAEYNGELYIAGSFSRNSSTLRIGRFDGVDWTWSAIGPGGNAKFVVHNDLLYASGYARWNDTSWTSLWSYTPYGCFGLSEVDQIMEYNGDLYGCQSSGLVQLQDSVWEAVGREPSFYGFIYAVASFNGDLIIGGLFAMYDDYGNGIYNLARWDGSGWSAILSQDPAESGCLGIVEHLAVFDGKLIVGGGFTEIDGVPASYIASWDGTTWASLGNGVCCNGASSSVVYDGKLVLVGNNLHQSDINADGFMAWDGSSWSKLGFSYWPESPAGVGVYDNQLFIAGGYWSEQQQTVYGRLDYYDGSSWHVLAMGEEYWYGSLAEYNDQLMVGGMFESIDGVTSPAIIGWDGTDWQQISSYFYPSQSLNHLIVYNGELYADVSGGPMMHWNGVRWSQLGSGLGYGHVNDMTIHDGELVVVGTFITAGGKRVQGVAGWNMPQACCTMYTGNVDNDPSDIADIGDLTALIGYLFIPPYEAPVCPEEANIDGEGVVDIGDLTALIGYLFIPPFDPPATCP